VLAGFGRRWLELETPDRQQVFQQAAALIKRWNTRWIQANLVPPQALGAHCLQHDLAEELEDIAACAAGTALAKDPAIN
jgi:hypothetical protein